MIASQQALDFTRPAARASDPSTSHAAAQDAKVHASKGRILVLTCLFNGPLTDFELAARTGWQQTSIGKRRGECVAKGWVEVNIVDGVKVKRPTPSASLALTWRITHSGKITLGAL